MGKPEISVFYLLGIGLLGGACALLFIVWYCPPVRSPRVLDSIPLAVAMRRAAEALPPMPEWQGPYGKKSWERELDYRRALSIGKPVVKGGRLKKLSRAFADALGDEDRERWLQACFEDLVQYIRENSHRQQLARTWAGQGSLAAIYNLTRDPGLREAAYNRWMDLERQWYDDELRRYNAGERCPSYPYDRINKPRMRPIPIWRDE